MANEVSIVVRARDATHSGFVGLERNLARMRTSLRNAEVGTGRMDRAMHRLRTGGLQQLRGAVHAADSGIQRLFNSLINLPKTMAENKMMTAKIVGGLLLLGPAAQAAAAALTVGLGAAFIGLGAYALKGDKQVQSAFRSMKEGVASSVREAALPLKPYLIDGMMIVRNEARRMQPALTRAFAAAGPLVAPLARGITGLASNALPGLTQALRNARPAMNGFETAMKLVGKGVGDMFATMTAGDRGRALQQVWVVLGNEIRRLMTTLGDFLGTAAQSRGATVLLVGTFRLLGAVVKIAEGSIVAIDGVIGVLFGRMLRGATDVEALASAFDKLGGGGGKRKQALGEMRADLRELDRGIADEKKALENLKYVVGPARNRHKDKLEELQGRRKDLLGQIAEAERDAAEATSGHARSVQELMDSMSRLNDRLRGEVDAQSGFEQAIDDAAEAARKHAGALRMVNGRLDLNSQAARDAYAPLSELAAKTQEAAEAAAKNGASWSQVNGIYARGRQALIDSAGQMTSTREEAKLLASQILKTPDKTAYLRGHIGDLEKKLRDAMGKLKSLPASRRTELKGRIADLEKKVSDAKRDLKSVPASKRSDLRGRIADLQRKIDEAKWQIKSVPSSKMSELKGRISDLNRKISEAKRQIKSVPASKRSELRGRIADLQAKVRAARAELASLRDRTVNVYVNRQYNYRGVSEGTARSGLAHGGIVGAAGGGPRSNLTLVGEQGPEYVRLPYGSRVIPAPRTKSMRKGEKEAVRDARGDLTISHFGQDAGYRRTEFRNDLSRPESLAALVGSLNQWRGTIQRATHGKAESRLLRDLDVAGRALIKNAKLHDRVSDALAKARDKLADLRQAAAQMREQVSSGIVQSGNITNSAGGEGHTTVGGIMGGLVEARDRATAFAKALATLGKRGLSKEAIAQIAQAGPEGGGLETAEALMGASRSEIRSMNKLQSQISDAAKAAGKTTADAMYGAGIKAAEGVVEGLKKNKKKIEAAMDDIAKALADAIRKGLGVGKKATGGIIGAASGGVRGSLTWVGEQGAELVRLPYGSTVYPAGQSRRMAAAANGAGGAGQPPMQINLVVDGRTLARVMFDPLRGEIRSRSGGNVQAALGWAR